MKNIIFIEGVSGVGKSTTVKLLSDNLRNNGYSTKYHLEGDPDSPLDLCWAAYMTIPDYEELALKYPCFADNFAENIIYKSDYILLRYQVQRDNLYPKEIRDELHKHEFCYNSTNKVPLSKFTEVFTDLWKRYEPECDYEIFDASLVSHMTNDIMRNYNASDDELISHLQTLINLIKRFNPVIFYLSSDNVRERLINARISRGQTPLDEDRINFWEKRKEKDLAILPNLSIESRIIDISNDSWERGISRIKRFLLTDSDTACNKRRL